MPIAKRNSVAIKQTDGRKNNGRKPGTKVQKSQPKLTPAKLNKAKKERIKLAAVNGIITEFGSEQAFWDHVAEQARKSFNHLDFLAKYAFGKAENVHEGQVPTKNAPVINFFSQTPPQIQNNNTIDIDFDEEENES